MSANRPYCNWITGRLPYVTITLISWSVIITFLSLFYPILYSLFIQHKSSFIEKYPWTWLTHLFIHGNGEIKYTLNHLGVNILYAALFGFFTEKILGSQKTLLLISITLLLCTVGDIIGSNYSLGCSCIINVFVPIFLYFTYCCFKIEGLSAFKNPLFDIMTVLALFSIYSGTIKPLVSGINLISEDVKIGVYAHIIGLIVGSFSVYYWSSLIKGIAEGLPHFSEFEISHNNGCISKGVITLLTLFLVGVLAYIPVVILKLSDTRQSIINLAPSDTIRQLNNNNRYLIVQTEEKMVPNLFQYWENISYYKHDKRFSIQHQWLDLHTIIFIFDRNLKKEKDCFTVICKLRSTSGKRYDFGLLLGRQIENIITVISEIKPEDSTYDSFNDTMKMYHKAADQGQAIAQTALGLKYSGGDDTEKDNLKSIKWYGRAVEQDEPIAMANLGYMYYSGNGVEINYNEAFILSKMSADLGNPIAQNNIAVMYDKGNGTQQDFKEALKWFLKSADQGYVLAQNNLAGMYLDGRGTSQDFDRALMWFRKSADQGDAQAQHNIAFMYEKGIGTTKDFDKALKWYRKAADQGFMPAQYNLAFMYENGIGINKDYIKSIKWYRMAAEHGNTEAQGALKRIHKKSRGKADR